jgi:hypothetical protein
VSVDTWQEAVALMPAPASVEAVDEALRWATAGGVRVQAYIDRLLDERLEAHGVGSA